MVLDEASEHMMSPREDTDYQSLDDSVRNLALNRVRAGRYLSDVIKNVLKKRIEIEKDYSAKLYDLANAVETPLTEEGTTLEAALLSMKNVIKSKAASADNFAVAVAEECERTVAAMVENHMNVYNVIQRDDSWMTAQIDALTTKYKTVRNELFNVAKETEVVVAKQIAAADEISLDIKYSNQLKSLGCLNKQELLEKAVSDTVDMIESLQEKHKPQNQNMMTAITDMDTKRVQCNQRVLEWLCVYELNRLKTDEYEVERLVKSVQDISPTEDITLFCRKVEGSVESTERFSHYVKVHKIPNIKYEKLTANTVEPISCDTGNVKNQMIDTIKSHIVEGLNLLTPTITNSFAKGFKVSPDVPTVKEAEPELTIENALMSYRQKSVRMEPSEKLTVDRYKGYITRISNDDFTILTVEVGETIKEELNTVPFREMLVVSFEQVLAETPDRTLTTKSMTALKVISKLILWAIDVASVHMDFPFIKWCLEVGERVSAMGLPSDDPQLGKKLHWPKSEVHLERLIAKHEQMKVTHESCTDDQFVRWTLSRCLYHHTIWSNITFWSAVLTSLLGQYKIQKYLNTRWSDAESARYLEIYQDIADDLSILTKFPQIMRQFGIQEESILTLLTQMCSKNNIDSSDMRNIFQDICIPVTEIGPGRVSSDSEAADQPSLKTDLVTCKQKFVIEGIDND